MKSEILGITLGNNLDGKVVTGYKVQLTFPQPTSIDSVIKDKPSTIVDSPEEVASVLWLLKHQHVLPHKIRLAIAGLFPMPLEWLVTFSEIKVLVMTEMEIESNLDIEGQ